MKRYKGMMTVLVISILFSIFVTNFTGVYVENFLIPANDDYVIDWTAEYFLWFCQIWLFSALACVQVLSRVLKSSPLKNKDDRSDINKMLLQAWLCPFTFLYYLSVGIVKYMLPTIRLLVFAYFNKDLKRSS